MYQFQVRINNGSRLELRFGWMWRLFFVACAVLAASAVPGDERLHPVPALLALVCLAAALFDERWVFDRSDGRVLLRLGFFPLRRRRVYPLQQVRSVKLRVSRPSGAASAAELPAEPAGDRYRRPAIPTAMQRGLIRLSITLQRPDGTVETVNMQTESHRRFERLQELGRTVADFCEVPFESPA